MPDEPRDVTICETPPCTTGFAGRALLAWFLLLIFSLPYVQVFSELRAGQPVQELDVFTRMPTLARLQEYERALEKNSVVSQGVQPYVRWLELSLLHSGTRKTVTGRGETLFFRPSVDAVVAPDFMTPPFAEGHPLPAIVAFRDSLQRLGVELVVFIVPGKETIYPAWLSGRYGDNAAPLTNPGMGPFLAELRRQGVRVVDPTEALLAARGPGNADPSSKAISLYLRQDTHWTPAGLEVALDALMKELREDLRGHRVFAVETRRVSNYGDLYDMLKLYEGRLPMRRESVLTRRVVDVAAAGGVEPDPASPVVLLGDSFTNIYSLPDMRWGDHAGLSEHLALRLGRRVDVIAHNDGGVNTARSALARRRDGLQGKRLVIWQFAARDLVISNGEWKHIDIAPPRKGE